MTDLNQQRKFRKDASFTLKNRLLRVLWNFVHLLLIRHSPVILNSWRVAIYRIFGANIAENVTIYPKTIVWAPWNLIMEADSCVANHVNIYNQGLIHIRKNALVSQGAYLCTGTHNYESKLFDLEVKAIDIGKNVWIAAEAFVGPGVKIGEGAILGARGVALREMEEWGVYIGNPATKIKTRREEVLWS